MTFLNSPLPARSPETIPGPIRLAEGVEAYTRFFLLPKLQFDRLIGLSVFDIETGRSDTTNTTVADQLRGAVDYGLWVTAGMPRLPGILLPKDGEIIRARCTFPDTQWNGIDKVSVTHGITPSKAVVIFAGIYIAARLEDQRRQAEGEQIISRYRANADLGDNTKLT